MSFVGRALSFTFTINSRLKGGTSTITIPAGLMASARVGFAGLPSAARMELTIWGLTNDIMNQLNTMGMVYKDLPINSVTLVASDADGTNPSVVFIGEITDARPELSRQPEAPIYIQAYSTAGMAVVRALPVSYTNESDIVEIVRSLASLAGKHFENNGVTGVLLANQYLWGTPLDQLKTVAKAVKDRGVIIDVVNDTVVMYYTKVGRGSIVPLVGPSSGLIGYPTYSVQGIDFRCIYNPNLSIGGQVQVESTSDLKQTSGLFNIYGLSHDLDAQIPGGKWESLVNTYRPGTPTPPLPPAR